MLSAGMTQLVAKNQFHVCLSPMDTTLPHWRGLGLSFSSTIQVIQPLYSNLDQQELRLGRG